MNIEFVRKLIEEGETFDVEFKGEKHAPIPDKELIESVVCLSNKTGNKPSYLLIGVNDDGSISGLQPRPVSGRIDISLVKALISNRTIPNVTVNVIIINIDSKDILFIEIPPINRPVCTSGGKYIRRAIGGEGKPSCVPYAFHEMQSDLATHGALDYSKLIIPGAKLDDIDPLEIERLKNYIRKNPGSSDTALLELPDVEVLKALGAIEVEGELIKVRIVALLLFGRSESITQFLPSYEVAFQVLKGTEIEVNDFFKIPLLKLIDELDSRFKARNSQKEVIVGMHRLNISDYAPKAFREAVANSLVHRDYSRLGAVYIQWYDNRMEISNPGGFPEGVHLNNILVTPPRPRNPLLADAFKRAGLVERTGRGVDTIFYEQIRNGCPAPSYERSTADNVMLILFGGSSNLNFASFVSEEVLNKRIQSLDDLLILYKLVELRSIDTNGASGLIQKPLDTARSCLERLVENGLLEARGSRKGRSYIFSHFSYEKLANNLAYIRQVGFKPYQHKQMILQYIEKNRSISRKEAAELCQINNMQAYRLLRSFVESGILEKENNRGRNVRYIKKQK